MSTDTGALGALLLADARLPTGGHAHSATLEAALEAGLPEERIPDYIRARLATVGRTEAAAAVVALRVAADPGPGPGPDYGPVQEALAARTPSRALREASASLGRGLARLARRVDADHPAVRALPTAQAATPGLRVLRPVVLGALGAVFGMTAEQTARAALYEDAQTVTAAALKLRPGDPLTAVRWLLDLSPEIEASVRAAAATDVPHDIPAHSAPLIDRWAEAHARETRRLFVA